MIQVRVGLFRKKAGIVLLLAPASGQRAEEFHCRHPNRPQLGQPSLVEFIPDFRRAGVFRAHQRQVI